MSVDVGVTYAHTRTCNGTLDLERNADRAQNQNKVGEKLDLEVSSIHVME